MKKPLEKNKIISFAIFLLGILAVLYYILVAQKVEFDSDFTDTVIWAEAMITGNGLFDHTMSYAYTLPFGGSLLMAPFVAIFGLGYTAHVLGFLVFLTIFVISLCLMIKNMGFSVYDSMLSTGVILILSLVTKDTRMTMWGHVIHYSLGVLFVVIAMVVYSKIDIKELSRENIKWIIALAVLTALFLTNGLTIVLFFAIPFFGALLVERFISLDEDLLCTANKNSLIIATVCGISGILGLGLSKVAQKGVITVYDGMFKKIPMWQNWIWDITERVRVFIVCCAGEVNDKIPMESFAGIRIMYMAFYGFVILFVPFIAAFSYKKIENRIIRMFLIAYYILLFATIFVYDFSEARGTAHRLVGLYMTAVICSVVYMMWLVKHSRLSRFGYVLALVLVGASLFSVYCTSSLRGQNRYEKLAEVLCDNNLKYGYSEYWSAQVTTILSNAKVEVYPITISEDGDVSKKLYNVREWQFETRDNVEKYFAFLSSWEYEKVKDTLGDEAIDVIPFDEDGFILVFDHNIF